METAIDYIFSLLVSLADKYTWISYALMVVGALYFILSALRKIIQGVAALTKTKTDDTIVASVYAFLDKFAYGWGKFEDYYDQKIEEKKDK